MLIRPLTAADLPAVAAIQASCYPPELLEQAECFAAKIAFSPASHWLAERDGEALGYLFCHPWQGWQPPELDSRQLCWPQPQAAADCFYLHDLAVAPSARGLGVAEQLIDTALSWARAQQLPRAMLIAVGRAPAFWQRHGFVVERNSADLHKYGAAELMSRTL
ncbi:GNAT family N-acetyltransferase [Chitinibacter tainanensis]|uniref:GNAT family N-acetyltransferase n=1 Tax=Chitinibacter tainanensis TaxID=230667 RepID=UPI002355BBA0|nr:N-acetyltransferase [Chitinibacter tainanensis]